jgi:hypothetical protein
MEGAHFETVLDIDNKGVCEREVPLTPARPQRQATLGERATLFPRLFQYALLDVRN